MKNRIVSEEEYQSALLQLSNIMREKERLKCLNESGNYNAHIQLGSSFEESLINLKRNNMRIDQNLELYRKSILSEFLATTRSDFDIIEKLDFIIEQKLVGLDTDEGSIGFEAIFDEMVCLNRQKEANQYLII